ncbi:hypothetical protein MBANPS3_004577 [Mucor bainieri]
MRAATFIVNKAAIAILLLVVFIISQVSAVPLVLDTVGGTVGAVHEATVDPVLAELSGNDAAAP